ncbi:MAG TPA: TIGR02266 family protein [Thermoanaerobaculia bacterium]|nr:TIGR02266 family protein [Thermoanaerobaculia bacterium]
MVDYSNIPRDSRRVPLETRVQFKFDRFFGFLSEYSSNISPGGMFINTQQPQPPGTVLDVEFSLGEDGFQLIQARGEVIWVRKEDQGPGRPAGMGLRFLELSDGSKELIYRMVDNYVQEGGVPFDLSLVPDEMPAAAKAAFPGAAAAAASLPRTPPANDDEPFDLSADPFQLEDMEPAVQPRQEVLVFPDIDTPAFPEPEADPLPDLDSLAPPPGGWAPQPAPEERPGEMPRELLEPLPEPAPWAAAEPQPEVPAEPSAPLLAREEPEPARWTSAPPPLEPESQSWSGVPRDPEAAPPPVYLPEPPPPREAPTPLVHYAGSARATEPRRSSVPWLIVLLVAVGALTAFVLMNEQIMDWAGLGSGEITAATPGRPLPRPRARATVPAPGGPPAATVTEGTPAAPVVIEEAPGATQPAAPAPSAPGAQTAAPAPVAAAPAPATGPPATVIQRITFERLPTGTEIVLWGNGAIRLGSYTRLRIDGNPAREVIKLKGIRQRYPSPRVGVGTPEVLQVRVGHHPGDELHVVLDLTGPRVQAAGFQEDGNRLRVLVQRP